MVREAGFKRVCLRGDCHFSLTEDFDYWTKSKVEFVFGVAGHTKLVDIADGHADHEWTRLRRKSRTATSCGRGARKPRVKKLVIEERGYTNLELEREDYTEFDYQPAKCSRAYRMVILRKTINVKQGQALLIPEVR